MQDCRSFICGFSVLLEYVFTSHSFQDFQTRVESSVIRGIDLGYQIARLRLGRFVPDAEVQMIIQTLSNNVRTYEQVVEVPLPLQIAFYKAKLMPYPHQLLSYLPLQNGGLIPLSFGLFHPISAVRDQTVDLFATIRSFKVRLPQPE